MPPLCVAITVLAHPELEFDIAIAFAAGCLALAIIAFWTAASARRELARREAAERQTRQLLHASLDGIYALDPQGHCLWANPAACRLFGYADAAPLLGRQMHHIIHHTRADGSPYPIEECTGLSKLEAGQDIVQGEELLWRADGTSFYADVRVSPVARDGRVEAALVVVRDLTERRRLETQIRQAQKLEAVGRLAAGIAHEFNNLLSVITGHADLLRQRRDLDDGAQRQLAAIEAAGARAAALTRRLLSFSRPPAPRAELVQLNATVRATAAMLGQVLRENIHLEMNLAPDLARLQTDPSQLEQALFNLIVNARDAMPNGGCLEIRTANASLGADAAQELRVAAGEYVRLTVADSGEGMSAETRQHIFEPFFTTKPAGVGTGLGLAMVFGFVQQHHGAIAVASEPGQGTSFDLYLPARHRVAAASPVPAEGLAER